MVQPTMTEPLDNPPPQDIPAERAVLGACLTSRGAWRDVSTMLTDSDFYVPAHAALWRLLAEFTDAGKPLDPLLLRQASQGHADPAINRLVGRDPMLLANLVGAHAIAASAGYYAQIVADKAMLRRVVEAGTRMAQRATTADADPVDTIEWAAEQIRSARDSRRGVQLLSESITTFMERKPERPDWVIPNLLARGDRFILTGGGGSGKSTLLRQIAVCAAAGLDPFHWDPIPPVKVTWFDRENNEAQNQGNFRSLLLQVKLHGLSVADTLRIDSAGYPLDLLNPHEALSLLRTVEADQPDLVYVGPVYKLHNDDPDKEMVVKRITSVLDQVRAMGCAIITEAHPNRRSNEGGSLAPSGANLWTWWPEFGRGLRMAPNYSTELRPTELEHWRFDRQPRHWPDHIQSGGAWPWQSAYPRASAA